MFAVLILLRIIARDIALRGRLPTEDSINLPPNNAREQLENRIPAEAFAIYERMGARYIIAKEVGLEKCLNATSVI
jgi:hypothetical protein